MFLNPKLCQLSVLRLYSNVWSRAHLEGLLRRLPMFLHCPVALLIQTEFGQLSSLGSSCQQWVFGRWSDSQLYKESDIWVGLWWFSWNKQKRGRRFFWLTKSLGHKWWKERYNLPWRAGSESATRWLWDTFTKCLLVPSSCSKWGVQRWLKQTLPDKLAEKLEVVYRK